MNPGRWNAILMHGASYEGSELLEELEKKLTCGRCGRPDMPLALLREHDKSCAFECAIGMPAIEKIEELEQKLQDKCDRVEELEGAVREVLRTVAWFEGWLIKDKIGYDARGVAHMKNEVSKVLGSPPEGTEKG